MIRKGQIITITRPFQQVSYIENIEDYIACTKEHKKRNLTGEVIEVSYCGDGMYNLLILLDCCKELHPILVEDEDVKIQTIKTLKRIKKCK